MEFTWSWEYVLAIIIVLSATAALCLGRLSQEQWYAAVSLAVAFVGGYFVGRYRQIKVN